MRNWRIVQHLLACAAAMLLAVAGAIPSARAETTQLPTFIMDWPLPASRAVPAWLEVRPRDPQCLLPTQEFVVVPPNAQAELSLTVYFQEGGDGFLRVMWRNPDKAEMLCDNLYEGVGMANQRTLLIPRSVLHEAGVLTLQASGKQLGLMRVEWSWVEPKKVLMPQDSPAPALVRNDGQTYDHDQVDGTSAGGARDQWKGDIVTAPLIEHPERIDDGVEFTAQLDAIPTQVRLVTKMLGVPVEKDLALWVNGLPITQVALRVPDLTDPGYLKQANGAYGYVGWREGAVTVPVSALKKGENSFKFMWVGSANITTGLDVPMAVKDLALQLRYESAEVEPAATGASELVVPQAAVMPQTSSTGTSLPLTLPLPVDDPLTPSSLTPLTLPTSSSTTLTPEKL